MMIDLASIGAKPKPVRAKFSSTQIDLENIGKLVGEAIFKGEIFRDDINGHVAGIIETYITLDCSRCLEPVVIHLEIPFDDVFVDASEESGETEAEIDPSEMDESLVIGGMIDLTEIVREQILLALPEQVFCKPACKGLCPKCGMNLNLIDCMCSDDEIDPRWVVLKNLK